MVAIKSGNMIGGESYIMKRINLLPNTKRSMSDYFALEKQFGGMITFWKVQIFTLSAFHLTMRKNNYHVVVSL